MATVGDTRIGSELLGYRLEALLGRGGMGVVYRAQDLALGRKVALKLLPPELAADEHFRERFQRESRLAASLDHPSIVPIYEAGEVHGQLYIAMRYVEGTDLKALLRREGALVPARALAIVAPVADALDEAHERGLVHRDVKPSNVLLDARERPYLADFGLTKRNDDGAELFDRALGTVDYVAPEAIEGERLDGRADVYSLGCLLYECLTGRVPFVRDSVLSLLWAHVNEPPPALESHPELDPVLAKALAKEPGNRFASCSELVEAVTQALPEPESRRRRRGAFVLAGALLAASALALVLGLRDESPNTRPTLAIRTHAIQRIDPTTNRLVATLRVPVAPFQLVAGGGSVWAADSQSSTVYRIDPQRNAVEQTLQTSGEPDALVFGAGSLWVLNADDGVVTRVDPATGKVATVVPLPSGTGPGCCPPVSFQAGEDGVWLSWASREGNAVFIDAQSNKAVPRQIGPADVTEIAAFVVAGRHMLWALGSNPHNPFETAFLRVDPGAADLSEPDVLPLSGGFGLCPVGDRRHVWLVDQLAGLLLRIDPRGLRVDRRVRVRADMCSAALGAGSVWVTSWYDGTVSRVDPASATVSAKIALGTNVVPGAISVGSGAVWVDVHPR